MKRVLSVFAAVVAASAVAQLASAQQPFANIQQQQTVSPYLNLLNRQNTGVPNYQTLVRPQIQSNQQFAQQQSQIQRLQHQQAGLAASGGQSQRGVSGRIRPTGQISHNRFMETSHFFPVRQ